MEPYLWPAWLGDWLWLGADTHWGTGGALAHSVTLSHLQQFHNYRQARSLFRFLCFSSPSHNFYSNSYHPTMASAPSSSRGRRQSQSTLAAMDVPRSRFHPAAIAGALIKHGKYVAFGAAGIWWLDLPSAVPVLLDSQHVWHK